MPSISGLPAVSDLALPAEVRSGSAEDKKAYKTALGFEQLLVGRLVKEAMPADEDAGYYGGAVQDAFAEGLMNAGGLGLASQIYAQIREKGAAQ
jgi:Rod binding domain-containing protein